MDSASQVIWLFGTSSMPDPVRPDTLSPPAELNNRPRNATASTPRRIPGPTTLATARDHCCKRTLNPPQKAVLKWPNTLTRMTNTTKPNKQSHR